MYGPSHHVHTLLRSSDEQKFHSDNSSVHAHLSEHVQSHFSANHNVQDPVIHRIPQLTLKQVRNESPTAQERTEAIAHLQCHKAAGVDSIPPEIWKLGGPMFHAKPYNLLLCHWKQGKLPKDFCVTIIITLHKDKGEKSLTAPIIWESTYSPSQGECLPESCSQDSYQPSPKESSPRASVTLQPTEAGQTWCTSSINSMINAKHKTRNYTPPLPASQKLLTQQAG